MCWLKLETGEKHSVGVKTTVQIWPAITKCMVGLNEWMMNKIMNEHWIKFLKESGSVCTKIHTEVQTFIQKESLKKKKTDKKKEQCGNKIHPLCDP